jgi:hypothetical protein
MAYIIRFDTRIEWVVSDEDEQTFIDCATPEMFIKYQEELLRPSTYTGVQSLEDFMACAVIKKGSWSYETDDAVEDMGEWHANQND